MKTREFFFDLPPELIAQHPPERRGESRLMRLDRGTGAIADHHIRDFPSLLPPDSVLVINDTRVRKARIYGRPIGDASGGEVEFLLIETRDARRWRAVVSRAKRQRPGRRYHFPGAVEGTVTGGGGAIREIEFSTPVTDEYLELHGHVPLPPYIRRADEPSDGERYQTVYAAHTGSVAAPTAGLHLTDEILDAIESRGVELLRVTLHVGLGTFAPVRVEQIEDHEMHREEYEVSEMTADRITRAKRDGRAVVAVGTTSVRTLESAWNGTALLPGRSSTGIFIYPGYEFGVVDALLTNFHTPESTLLMLVSAFAGRERVLAAYREAVARRYRFFSYGDAMYIG